MEAARFEVGPSRRIAQQGDFGGKAEVTLNVFFDSSALAKRYIEEERKRSGSGRPLFGFSVSRLGDLRFRKSSRLCAAGGANAKFQLKSTEMPKASVLSDIDDATVIGITEEVIAQAVALLEQFPLRSADALHVACASEWSTDLFVSADDRQCAAARAHGLRVRSDKSIARSVRASRSCSPSRKK